MLGVVLFVLWIAAFVVATFFLDLNTIYLLTFVIGLGVLMGFAVVDYFDE